MYTVNVLHELMNIGDGQQECGRFDDNEIEDVILTNTIRTFFITLNCTILMNII